MPLNEVQEALKQRYVNLHPLIFLRSLEKARSDVELFDILDGVSKEQYPVIWSEEEYRWKHTEDILQSDIIEG